MLPASTGVGAVAIASIWVLRARGVMTGWEIAEWYYKNYYKNPGKFAG
jgi:hypothetical protein